MGTSGEINYVVKGTGTVEEVNQEKKAGYMTVKLDGYDGPEEISIQIGSVYKGSSVRDSLDVIKFGDYTNQQDWAAVSQSINEMIDEEIVKKADPASLKGKTISFTNREIKPSGVLAPRNRALYFCSIIQSPIKPVYTIVCRRFKM